MIEQAFFNEAFLEQQWPQIKQSYIAQDVQATSPQDREAIITQMLAELGASHTVLITPELAQYIEQQEVDEARIRLHFQRLGTTVFATLPSFKVRSLPLVDLEQLAAHCSGISHLVLDLRLNDGGSGSVVSEVASMFLPADIPLFSIRDRAGFRLARPWVVSTFPEAGNLDHELEVAAILQRSSQKLSHFQPVHLRNQCCNWLFSALRCCG